MKILRSVVSIVLTLIFVFTPSVTHASTSDFTFKSFTAKYFLGRDVENRSTMRVEEELVAQFPNFDQNHGIERSIPNIYDGHSVDLRITGVFNADGLPRNYATYIDNDNTILRIGDPDKYVQGLQVYLIEYSLRDVTKAFTNGDELYWDINGTEWQQPFGEVNATVYLDDAIKDSYDQRLACYVGTSGSTAQDCTVVSNKSTISATTTHSLMPGENLSIVIGFKPGTFSAYVEPPVSMWLLLFIFVIVPILYVLVPLVLIIWGIKKWRQQGRDYVKQSTIVPQYLPLKNVSILQCDIAIHTKMTPKAVSAAIIDLAVRHYLKIYEVKKNEYEIEVQKLDNYLLEDDKVVLDILFGAKYAVGDKLVLKEKKNIYQDVADLAKKSYELAIINGYMADTRRIQKKMYIVAGILMFISICTLNALMLIATIILLVIASHMPARTTKGVELKTYLDGTEMYMKVAEADRLKFLQAPGTEHSFNMKDPRQLVKLYERLLPLAMLYGIEKEWANQFAKLYTNENQPDWFNGNYSTFNYVAFAGAMSNFGTSSTNSFSPPSSSSSSGFSGGGSGAGGGGGGGGGW